MIKELEITKPKIDKKVEDAVNNLINPTKSLILINDDYNTIDYVINCLIKYCNHSLEQAEQCTLIVHYNGKCAIKHGSFEKLKPICEILLKSGLTVSIE